MKSVKGERAKGRGGEGETKRRRDEETEGLREEIVRDE